ncbi:hydrophobic/amphiphilic exporter-1, HAE1 family [Catalinimonas alkaloidigena]|uniref:Hydrophobic/amphiphilic exporter-1, HAE1 family n=1 Tax=Catalinimonas alkaloidigena TaxID=1075417 RepID=A0A1G9ATR1_9BACT|nr:multidrug efflux RND transporter permease subunit [Catalinimonas alkaloidigena]SDK30726.1 hydrophobic/amphiphilic exporter-1, HAE1 family [Catalinimonas alkaloidigena]
MIAKTFIERPITAIVASVVITLLGVLAIITLPVSQYPDITPPVVQVTGNFTGADALTVEQTVATPIETQVNGVPDMLYLQTNSTSDGTMTMSVTFDVGTNVDIAALDVQNRVSVATPQLPDEVRRLGLTVRKRSPSILMLVAIYSPNQTHDVKFLDNYANIFIRDALLRVDGVGDVFSRADDFSMRLWLQPDKLASYGLTASDVISAVQEQNVQVAAGSVGAPPQYSANAFEYKVLVSGRLTKPEEFEDIVIRTKPEDGSIVYLKDVGRVELGKFNYSGNSFVDGNRASYLLVYQTPGSNALETAEGVYEAMERLSQSFPADVSYIVPFEAASVVEVSIDEVVHTLVEALILVVIVVFLFLQNWRATIIPILAIPVSIIATFVFFIPLGFTINTLTLFGFVLAIGIVVDDAIVVVEAVQHKIDHDKMTPKEATVQAMEEISGPVIAIALILAAVFVPVGFIPGIVGRLYQQFAITIAISVLISAFVALSLTPALCSLFLRPQNLDKNSRGINKLFYKFNQWFERTTTRYTSGVRKSINYSRYVVVFLICLLVGTVFLFRSKATGFIPVEDEGRLYITFELPEAASTARTVDVLHEMMDILKETPGVGHYAALAGLNVVTFSNKSNNGTIFCQLKPWDERKDPSLSNTAILADLQRRFAPIKEATVLVIPPPPIPGLGRTGGFSFVLEQRESTDDIKQFEQTVQQFVAAVNERPEIERAFSYFTARTPGYQITVNREKCKKLGVNLSDVFNTMQTYLGSRYINDFTLYGRNFRVVAQADTSFRNEIDAMGKYYVRNREGNMLPLSTLIDYDLTESATLISHYNLFRSTEVNGNPAPGYSSGDAIQALREVADEVLPAGYGYEFSGLTREEINSGSSTVYIFALSILFVFLFLAALYESWSVPFAVLLAVPVGAFGAILILSFSSQLTNNVYAQIGLITLIGLAAKNAILIVEFAKERVDSGEDLLKATLQAAQLRLRPIIMTSLAFILGVLPLALSSGAGAIARRTIGWTVLGGMVAATLLGIFIVPVLYLLITKAAYGKKKLAELRAQHQTPAG